MKKKQNSIDVLISEHTDRQLQAVDWNHLYRRIQKRLDDAGQPAPAASVKRKVFRWAVGTAAAAAVLFAGWTLIDDKNPQLSLPPGQRAAVQMIDRRAVADTEIKQPAAAVTMRPRAEQTQVRFSQPERETAHCAVTIIEPNAQVEKENIPRPSWIIITASKPDVPENQTNQDQLDIACIL